MRHNSYLIKALEAYPYDLEEAIESLNYALSYEPNNPMALYLMGRIYAEVYYDYTSAIQYFEGALEENVTFTLCYSPYILTLIHNEDYEKATRFIDYAMTVKSVDKGMLLTRKAMIYECQNKYKKALATIKSARKFAYNDDFMNFLDEFKGRIKKKMPKKRKVKK